MKTRNLLPALFALASLTPVYAATPREAALADAPLAYYELGISGEPGRSIAVNQGTTGTAANGTHFPGAVHQVPGAILGSTDTAINYRAVDTNSNDVGYPTVLPWQEEMNTQSFSAEAWVRPTSDGPGNACVVFRNHTDSGNRTGWVLWQRTPAQGWNLRLYRNSGADMAINLTAGTYVPNEWTHLTVTYDNPTRTARIYVNGTQAGAATIAGGIPDYVPLLPGLTPSFGGFANGRDNPFRGDIDEVAYYNKVLTAGQVQAHYANAINPGRSTPYETLVTADAPVAYYRQNEAAVAQVPNLGSLGNAAVGTLVNNPAVVDGPAAPGYPGFPVGTQANLFDANTSYVELNNPAGLNFTGAVTLTAWIQPELDQANSATIIAHGGDPEFNEVYLRIENGNYQVGNEPAGEATGGRASAAVEPGDLGTTGWIHLAGVWENGQWTLYRNGQPVATGASAQGANTVDYANWAIGARGRRKFEANQGQYPGGPVPDQRVFNGAIATAGIYNTALSAERIQAQYQAGVTPGASLSTLFISQSGTSATLTWEAGILQESVNMSTWTDVAGATSPYTTTIGDKRFFRLRD